MIRTFVDSGVLIAAARVVGLEADRAQALLSDDSRIFLSSPFIQLEVQPKAEFYLRTEEGRFYERFFESVIGWAAPSQYLINSALEIATRYGLAAMDALHIAGAIALDAHEFITGEKPTSPLFRVRGIKIISLFD